MLSQNSIEENSIEQNKEKESIKKKTPTLEEVEEYIQEKNLNVSAKQFYDYFEEGNWVDSKGNKVKNWKQKLLTWNKFTPKEQAKENPRRYYDPDNEVIDIRKYYDNFD